MLVLVGRYRGWRPDEAPRAVAACAAPFREACPWRDAREGPASSLSPPTPDHCRDGYPVEHHRLLFPRREKWSDAGPVSNSRKARVFLGCLPCLCLSGRSGPSRLSALCSASPSTLARRALTGSSAFSRPCRGQVPLEDHRGFSPWPKPRAHRDGPVRVAAPRRRLRARVFRPTYRLNRSWRWRRVGSTYAAQSLVVKDGRSAAGTARRR